MNNEEVKYISSNMKLNISTTIAMIDQPNDPTVNSEFNSNLFWSEKFANTPAKALDYKVNGNTCCTVKSI